MKDVIKSVSLFFGVFNCAFSSQADDSAANERVSRLIRLLSDAKAPYTRTWSGSIERMRQLMSDGPVAEEVLRRISLYPKSVDVEKLQDIYYRSRIVVAARKTPLSSEVGSVKFEAFLSSVKWRDSFQAECILKFIELNPKAFNWDMFAYILGFYDIVDTYLVSILARHPRPEIAESLIRLRDSFPTASHGNVDVLMQQIEIEPHLTPALIDSFKELDGYFKIKAAESFIRSGRPLTIGMNQKIGQIADQSQLKALELFLESIPSSAPISVDHVDALLTFTNDRYERLDELKKFLGVHSHETINARDFRRLSGIDYRPPPNNVFVLPEMTPGGFLFLETLRENQVEITPEIEAVVSAYPWHRSGTPPEWFTDKKTNYWRSYVRQFPDDEYRISLLKTFLRFTSPSAPIKAREIASLLHMDVTGSHALSLLEVLGNLDRSRYGRLDVLVRWPGGLFDFLSNLEPKDLQEFRWLFVPLSLKRELKVEDFEILRGMHDYQIPDFEKIIHVIPDMSTDELRMCRRAIDKLPRTDQAIRLWVQRLSGRHDQHSQIPMQSMESESRASTNKIPRAISGMTKIINQAKFLLTRRGREVLHLKLKLNRVDDSLRAIEDQLMSMMSKATGDSLTDGEFDILTRERRILSRNRHDIENQLDMAEFAAIIPTQTEIEDAAIRAQMILEETARLDSMRGQKTEVGAVFEEHVPMERQSPIVGGSDLANTKDNVLPRSADRSPSDMHQARKCGNTLGLLERISH